MVEREGVFAHARQNPTARQIRSTTLSLWTLQSPTLPLEAMKYCLDLVENCRDKKRYTDRKKYHTPTLDMIHRANWNISELYRIGSWKRLLQDAEHRPFCLHS